MQFLHTKSKDLSVMGPVLQYLIVLKSEKV